MLDKSVPYHPILMWQSEPQHHEVHLPEAYRIVRWEPGWKEDWIRIQLDSHHIDSYAKAEDVWETSFSYKPDWLATRMLFVLNEHGLAVATVALWSGDELGREMAQLHWLATATAYQGKGLARALTATLLNLYLELQLQGGIYLGSQTNSYPAINIYQDLGFKRYLGPMPKDARVWNNDAAWKIIDEKISAYKEGRRLV